MACSLQSGSFLLSKTAPNRSPTSQFLGNPLVLTINQKPISFPSPRSLKTSAQASYCVSKTMRWWEKTLKPNMIEIQSAQELVDTLNNAGDRLVVVDFYSPACGACKFLHPKMCQLAESNPGALFLKVNQEELKNMCNALHIHVLPFFRFYKGYQGRVCSFSCTLSTIKKFKDALAKNSSESQSGLAVGPAKGLDESELMGLASVGEISLTRTHETQMPFSVAKDTVQNATTLSKVGAQEDKSLVVAQ